MGISVLVLVLDMLVLGGEQSREYSSTVVVPVSEAAVWRLAKSIRYRKQF